MTARLPDTALNTAQVLDQVSQAWDSDIVERLSEYIAIPAKSPAFDADWAAHGYLSASEARLAVLNSAVAAGWRLREVADAKREIRDRELAEKEKELADKEKEAKAKK